MAPAGGGACGQGVEDVDVGSAVGGSPAAARTITLILLRTESKLSVSSSWNLEGATQGWRDHGASHVWGYCSHVPGSASQGLARGLGAGV